MSRIIVGNTTGTPYPRPDWNQTDETKADYIKNKPDIDTLLQDVNAVKNNSFDGVIQISGLNAPHLDEIKTSGVYKLLIADNITDYEDSSCAILIVSSSSENAIQLIIAPNGYRALRAWSSYNDTWSDWSSDDEKLSAWQQEVETTLGELANLNYEPATYVISEEIPSLVEITSVLEDDKSGCEIGERTLISRDHPVTFFIALSGNISFKVVMNSIPFEDGTQGVLPSESFTVDNIEVEDLVYNNDYTQLTYTFSGNITEGIKIAANTGRIITFEILEGGIKLYKDGLMLGEDKEKIDGIYTRDEIDARLKLLVTDDGMGNVAITRDVSYVDDDSVNTVSKDYVDNAIQVAILDTWNEHANNTDVHITTNERSNWNDKYTKEEIDAKFNNLGSLGAEPIEVVQTMGDSVTAAMSQKATTEAIANINLPTIYNDDITITEDDAIYNNCIFNGKVTVSGAKVKLTNCIFNNTVKVTGKEVQIKNVTMGGTEANPLSWHCLEILETATDIIVSDVIISRSNYSGIYYASYGGNISNFTIHDCYQYGIRICSGGVQLNNGKIFTCGRRDNAWSGGLIAYAPSGSMQTIPELAIKNVSIQQNYKFGMKLYNVQNSYIDVILLANCANMVENPNENGVFQSLYNNTERDYGMALYNCKNVSGNVNGVSCHEYWFGADKGYYDEVPSQNNINVTWEPCYRDTDVYKYNFLHFAKFLPEVRAEFTAGLPMGRQFTEADFVETDAFDLSSAAKLNADGTFNSGSYGRRRIRIEKKSIVTKKGKIRIYAEAPGLNIYPYIKMMNSDGSEAYNEIAVDTDAVRSRGQNSVYSDVITYNVGNKDLSNVSAFFLMFEFINPTNDDLSGSLTPAIRVEHYPY